MQKLKNYGVYKQVNKEKYFSCSDILKEGTFVRLLTSRSESIFSKSYNHNYTEEIFVISRVEKLIPIRYYLKDLLGEDINGTVYRQELKETELPDSFAVEKIIESKIDPKTKKNHIMYNF